MEGLKQCFDDCSKLFFLMAHGAGSLRVQSFIPGCAGSRASCSQPALCQHLGTWQHNHILRRLVYALELFRNLLREAVGDPLTILAAGSPAPGRRNQSRAYKNAAAIRLDSRITGAIPVVHGVGKTR